PGVADWKDGSVGLDPAAHSEKLSKQTVNVTNIQEVEVTKPDWTELKIAMGAAATVSSGVLKDENLRKEPNVGTRATTAEPDPVDGPHSVQWMDMDRLRLLADPLEQYQFQLLSFCTSALSLKLHVASSGTTAGSINLQDDHRSFQILHTVNHALETGNLHMLLHVLSSHINALHTQYCGII
ncbi:hypothetical protein ATANTOWER_025010, partial [Ataeniobius toweri]|nr:hypothetical protein [Ataeniobius toweri]